MIIVSNASPLIYLAKIGKLNLLRKLFKKVLIPEEVFYEVVVRGKKEGFSEALVIENAVIEKWISIRSVKVDDTLLRYARELDEGEIEVIVLSRQVNANLILIDDATGRRVAESLGLNVKGTLYVLLKAHALGLLSTIEVRKYLDKMISLGFRISAEVYSEVLTHLGIK